MEAAKESFAQRHSVSYLIIQGLHDPSLPQEQP